MKAGLGVDGNRTPGQRLVSHHLTMVNQMAVHVRLPLFDGKASEHCHRLLCRRSASLDQSVAIATPVDPLPQHRRVLAHLVVEVGVLAVDQRLTRRENCGIVQRNVGKHLVRVPFAIGR